MTAVADRHLLFGLLALQNGLINQGQLLAAFQAWMLDKSKSLADHLEARGDLAGAKRALLEGLAKVQLEAQGGDIEERLAAVPANRPTPALLDGLCETRSRTLPRPDHPGQARGLTDAADDNPDRTDGISVGSLTSDGQRFRVLRPHARGGLGTVFVALDTELHREVALKQIIEKHADDPDSRQRFIAEAEITGGLEHPGIVPVYGLGTQADGRPYYAMRFVRGDSLKEAIDRFHQSDWPAISTLSPVADEGGRAGAGVIIAGTRDLALRKLLRRFLDVCNAVDYAHSRGVIHRDIKPANIIVGKFGETLVVDWGLAKAVGRADPSLGERTIAPSTSGSSETLPGSALGTPAYMSPEQARGELDHLGPRSDVYSLGATLYCLLCGRPPFGGDDMGAILRAVQEGKFPPPTRVDPGVDRALEAECLKAMAARPEDRYATPKALADDLERWMADEPVSAWREPLGRRLRRWMRRNRTAVASAAVAILAVLAGLGAVAGVQTRANGELMALNSRLNRANLELVAEKARVQQRFDLALEAIQTFHTGVSEDFLLKEDQFKDLRDRLLRGAAGFYEKLEGLLREPKDLDSRAVLGQAYHGLGDLTRKIGSRPEALALHRKALAIRRTLVAESGVGGAAMVDVARSLIAVGLLQEESGDTAGALASFVEARALAEGLAASPSLDDSIRAVLAMAIHRIGRVQIYNGHPAEALAAWEQALAIREPLAKANPAKTEFQRDLALSLMNIGGAHYNLGHSPEAMAWMERARAISEALARPNPAVTQFQADLAMVNDSLGLMKEQAGRLNEALESYGRARALTEALAKANPAVTLFHHFLARSHAGIGRVRSAMGHPAEAIESCERARALSEAVAKANPASPVFQQDLAEGYTSLADVLRALGRPDEARAGYERAIATLEPLVKANPTYTPHRGILARATRRRGLARWAADDVAGAIADTRRALALFEGLPTRPGPIEYELACCHSALAGLTAAISAGPSPGDGRIESDRAMAQLRRAAAAGYGNLAEMRTESALDPLRDRPDFRLLMMDLAMPAEPFASAD